jgi:hypothetical protein
MNENIKKFVQLIQDNPTLPVKVKVDTRLNEEDDIDWYIGQIGLSCIHEYYKHDGRIYLTDYFEDSVIDKLYQEAKENGDIKKAIFVNIIT